jgi:hypothetical protein
MNVKVSAVNHFISEQRDCLIEPRYSNSRGPHVNAAAPGAQVHRHSDYLGLPFHSMCPIVIAIRADSMLLYSPIRHLEWQEYSPADRELRFTMKERLRDAASF